MLATPTSTTHVYSLPCVFGHGLVLLDLHVDVESELGQLLVEFVSFLFLHHHALGKLLAQLLNLRPPQLNLIHFGSVFPLKVTTGNRRRRILKNYDNRNNCRKNYYYDYYNGQL